MGHENSSNKRVFCTIHPACCARGLSQMPVTKDLGRKWEGCITFAVCGCHGREGVSRSLVNFWGLFRIGDHHASLLHSKILSSFGGFACSIFEVWFTWLSYVWLLKAQVDEALILAELRGHKPWYLKDRQVLTLDRMCCNPLKGLCLHLVKLQNELWFHGTQFP
jgi:hypothetical protein